MLQTISKEQKGNYEAELRISREGNENNEIYVDYEPKPINSATVEQMINSTNVL